MCRVFDVSSKVETGTIGVLEGKEPVSDCTGLVLRETRTGTVEDGLGVGLRVGVGRWGSRNL